MSLLCGCSSHRIVNFWHAFGLAVILFGFCWISPSSAAKAPLFIKNGEAIKLGAVDPSIVLRQRTVRIDLKQMPFEAPPERLTFNFFDNAIITADQHQIKTPDPAFKDALSWRGRIGQQSRDHVTLIRRLDSVSIIALVAERRYDVRPLKNGIHVIQEIALPRLRAVAGDETNAALEAGEEPDAQSWSQEIALVGMNGPAVQVFTLTNQERAKYDLYAYKADSRLVQVAQTHSQAQADDNSMYHTSKTGELYAAQGYDWAGWAENVAYGSPMSSYATPEGVVAGWMNSPSHRDNILGELCDLGVGRAVSKSGNVFWSQNFGIEHGATQCGAPDSDDGDAGDDTGDDPGDDTGDDPGDDTGDDPGDDTGDDPGDDTDSPDGSSTSGGDGGTGCFVRLSLWSAK